MSGDRLEAACLGVLDVYLEDLSFQWHFGTQQRDLDAEWLDTLCQKYRDHGVKYALPKNYIVVLCDGDKFIPWAKQAGLTIAHEDEENGKLQFLDGESARGCRTAGGGRLEVQCGMHRIHALKQMVIEDNKENLNSDELDAEVNNRVHWYAVVYNSRKLKKSDLLTLEDLRINEEVVQLADSEGVIWRKELRLAVLEEKKLFGNGPDLGPRLEAMRTKLLGNFEKKDQWNRLWDSQWKEYISELVFYPAYCKDFDSGKFDTIVAQKRITWYWRSLVQQMIHFLHGLFGNSKSALDYKSLMLFHALPVPRSKKDVEQLFYTSGGMRNEHLLPALSNTQYESVLEYLLEHPNVPFYTCKDLAVHSCDIGQKLNVVMKHVCRWVDPFCMPEAQTNPIKICSEDVLIAEFNSRIQSGVLGSECAGLAKEKGAGLCDKIADHVITQSVTLAAVDLALEPARQTGDSDLRVQRVELYQSRFTRRVVWKRIGRAVMETFGPLSHAVVKGMSEEDFGEDEEASEAEEEGSGPGACLETLVSGMMKGLNRDGKKLLPKLSTEDIASLLSELMEFLWPKLVTLLSDWERNIKSGKDGKKTWPPGCKTLEQAKACVRSTLDSLQHGDSRRRKGRGGRAAAVQEPAPLASRIDTPHHDPRTQGLVRPHLQDHQGPSNDDDDNVSFRTQTPRQSSSRASMRDAVTNVRDDRAVSDDEVSDKDKDGEVTPHPRAQGGGGGMRVGAHDSDDKTPVSHPVRTSQDEGRPMSAEAKPTASGHQLSARDVVPHHWDNVNPVNLAVPDHPRLVGEGDFMEMLNFSPTPSNHVDAPSRLGSEILAERSRSLVRHASVSEALPSTANFGITSSDERQMDRDFRELFPNAAGYQEDPSRQVVAAGLSVTGGVLAPEGVPSSVPSSAIDPRSLRSSPAYLGDDESNPPRPGVALQNCAGSESFVFVEEDKLDSTSASAVVQVSSTLEESEETGRASQAADETCAEGDGNVSRVMSTPLGFTPINRLTSQVGSRALSSALVEYTSSDDDHIGAAGVSGHSHSSSNGASAMPVEGGLAVASGAVSAASSSRLPASSNLGDAIVEPTQKDPWFFPGEEGARSSPRPDIRDKQAGSGEKRRVKVDVSTRKRTVSSTALEVENTPTSTAKKQKITNRGQGSSVGSSNTIVGHASADVRVGEGSGKGVRATDGNVVAMDVLDVPSRRARYEGKGKGVSGRARMDGGGADGRGGEPSESGRFHSGGGRKSQTDVGSRASSSRSGGSKESPASRGGKSGTPRVTKAAAARERMMSARKKGNVGTAVDEDREESADEGEDEDMERISDADLLGKVPGAKKRTGRK